MPRISNLHRLAGLPVLLVLALLLCFHTFKQLDLLPFGRQDQSLALSSLTDFSSQSSHQGHVKRDQELLNRFGCLVNKGIKHFEEGVVYSYEGFGDPPPDFGHDPFGDNGWTVSDAEDPLPAIWDEVFEDIPPREPTPDEYNFVKLEQDQNFANAWHQDNQETGATYNGFYIPFSNTILMTWTYSPRHHVRRRGIPNDQIEKFIPRLNTVSDVVWETWKAIVNQPAKLRFYAVDGVINSVARPLLDYLFLRDRKTTIVEWEDRLTFGLDSDEGKALFATPSGVAVAWLLVHHHNVLGRRDPREAQTARIDLSEDDEHALKRMLVYLYTESYDDLDIEPEMTSACDAADTPDSAVAHLEPDSASDIQAILCNQAKSQGAEQTDDSAKKYAEQTVSALLNNVRVYALADKYDIQDLKVFAKSKFESRSSSAAWEDIDILAVLEEVYSTTPSADRGLRDIMAKTCSSHLKNIISCSRFREYVQKDGTLGFELLSRVYSSKEAQWQLSLLKTTEAQELKSQLESKEKELREREVEIRNGKLEAARDLEQMKLVIGRYGACRHCKKSLDLDFSSRLCGRLLLRCNQCGTKY
ncbi:MAG: hypothetical protein Q9166_003975 [cf. Caloplaca sp. 2 TL-2023]